MRCAPQGDQAADQGHKRRKAQNDWQEDESWRGWGAENAIAKNAREPRAENEADRAANERERQVLRQKER